MHKKIIGSIFLLCLLGSCLAGNTSSSVTEANVTQKTSGSNSTPNSTPVDAHKNVVMLGHGNVAILRGEINARSTSKFLSELMKIDSDDIYIYMITPGGSVTHGHQIINAIEALSDMGKNVYCIGDVVNSMGFAILQSCPTRYVRSNSILMQHQMSLGLKGSIEHIRSRMKFVDQLEEVIERIQYERLGMSEEEFTQFIMNDWWMYGQSAVNNSVADEVINVLCTRELASETISETVHTIFGSFNLIYSKCPLIWDPLDVEMEQTSNDTHNQLVEFYNENKQKYEISKFIEETLFQQT